MTIKPNLYQSVLFISIVAVLGIPSIVPAQLKRDSDPLKVYTRCKWFGDLKVKQVDRRPDSTPKFRHVLTMNGEEKVSVLDGYRVMFGYKDISYNFVDVKIEQSEPSSYDRDKERVINGLKYLSSTKQATGNTFIDKAMLNEFHHYGLDRDQIDIGVTVGTHLLLYDPDHLIVTVYFLNQKEKRPPGSTAGNGRRFKDLDEFHKLKDDFLNRYSECLKGIAATRGQSSSP